LRPGIPLTHFIGESVARKKQLNGTVEDENKDCSAGDDQSE
jgi:hypothetical protein